MLLTQIHRKTKTEPEPNCIQNYFGQSMVPNFDIQTENQKKQTGSKLNFLYIRTKPKTLERKNLKKYYTGTETKNRCPWLQEIVNNETLYQKKICKQSINYLQTFFLKKVYKCY